MYDLLAMLYGPTLHSPVQVMLPPWYDAVVASSSAKHENGVILALE